MAGQKVHGRPDGRMGEQDSFVADMGGAPDQLHQKMAGMQTKLCNNGKAIVF